MGTKGSRYNRDFKVKAANLVIDQGLGYTQVSRDLGISVTAIRRWVAELKHVGQNAFPGSGNVTPQEEHFQALEKEIRQLTMERDILKKALGFFAALDRKSLVL